jgi:hypothetical protein
MEFASSNIDYAHVAARVVGSVEGIIFLGGTVAGLAYGGIFGA